ncbi:DUF6794 domain-containing protein [Chryseobacterium caseinilyticum]|uniref:DUF6794 domain-containing protein n=1 Tax=Chryseobacterium caseinilyticum TaxID=2771428 RepID=A0ABR8ZF42_9FLAO|nr:DUF6794 domain-containing protein [Chryseobacterium caseinilyticum]MBD8083912.1 hypothetical protein [Chryseobacterium caseinilyticum]
MKLNYYLLIIFLLNFSVKAQYSSSAFTNSKTFSANQHCKIVSYSFDDEFPTERGFSEVYDITFNDSLIYTIPRSFDLEDASKNFFLFISNDGKKVAYFSSSKYYEDKDDQKSVMIYESGKLYKKYGFEEFTNCDPKNEKCGLFFPSSQLIDNKKSNNNIITLKSDIDDSEAYLLDNFIFNKNDSIYVIDARKKVSIYDFNNLSLNPVHQDFKEVYKDLKFIRKRESSFITSIQSPNKYINNFESIITGQILSETIEKMHNLKFVSIDSQEFHKYHLYRLQISGYLKKDGSFEVEKFDIDENLSKDKILNYIQNTKFKSDFLPKEVDKFHFKYFFGGYRNSDDKIAERITLQQKQKREEDLKKRLTLSEIDGIYIPRSMQECMSELDKILNYESKSELKKPSKFSDFNGHMGGLGMWIRNNWGINGGSRLLQYFKERNIGTKRGQNDFISGTIINNYIKWVNGNKKVAIEWEKENPKK